MNNPFVPMANAPMPGPFGNFQQMIQSFNQFKNSIGNIDPKQTVMNMVNSGQVSQSQLNQAQQMARQFQQMMGGMK